MALTITNEVRKAALDGALALVSGGSFQLTNTAGGAGAELASLPISSVGAATTASPSVAVLSLTADSSVTAGTILGFNIKTSGAANRISGNVGTSGSDLNVTDNVIPGGATSVSCPGGISISLTLS